MKCRDCDRELSPDEPVLLVSVEKQTMFGWRDFDALQCRPCADAMHQRELAVAEDDFDRRWADPYRNRIEKPCQGCGRSILVSRYRPRKHIVACGTECRREWEHKRRRVMHYTKSCSHCGESFQPKRSTATYCSPKCRVYSNRKSKSMKGAA